MNLVAQFPEIAPLVEGSDHIDVKTIEGQTSLDRFIASMLSFYPWWILLLYRMRAFLAQLLGLHKQPAPQALPHLRVEDVSFAPGDQVTFLTVRRAKEEHYWVGETPEDKHLRAFLGVFVEPMTPNCRRFHVATIVHYKHWTGPVYFNIIRPFHHLVVSRMARAGVRPNR